MGTLEIIAVILGVINVTLVVRRSIWNYPFAILMVSLYAHIFYETRLYSDALLQIFFVVVNLYGWWYWARQQQAEGDIRVRVMPAAMRAAVLAICIVAIAGWGTLMHRFTDALFPWWDSAIAMLSVTAQILMTRRYIENWVLWIGVDILAIGLFAARGLQWTAALYVIFLALSIWGLEEWMRVRRETPATV